MLWFTFLTSQPQCIPNGGEGYFRLYLCHCRKVPVKRGNETLLVLKERMTLHISLYDHYVQNRRFILDILR